MAPISAIRPRPSPQSCTELTCRAWPISIDRQAYRFAATRSAIREASSIRITRKLGRIPDGGGHRALGRAVTPHSQHAGLGHDHFEVVIDDRSRRSVVVHVPDETGASAASALATALAIFATEGIEVEQVMTDNGLAYRSNAYRAVLGDRRHPRTRPYRPQTNGKAERISGTLVREWAYSKSYRSNSERLDALPGFVDFYNRTRPHTALGGLSPIDVVNNVRGDHG